MEDKPKEMTELGPISRVGDSLSAMIWQRVNSDIDWWLDQGFVSQSEHMVIRNQVDGAVSSILEGLPDDLRNRSLNSFYRSKDDQSSITLFLDKVRDLLGNTKESSFDDSEWSGAASNWSSTEAYCADCLIDVNPSGEEKTQTNCMLPLSKEGSSKPNRNALRAMAGGRGISAVKKPDGVSEATWSAAKRKAAKRIKSLWSSAFDTEVPESIASMAKDVDLSEPPPPFIIKGDEHWDIIGFYSNKWIDRDDEIIPEAAHIEYAQWVKETGFEPVITLYHQPKMAPGFWTMVFDAWENDIEKLNQVVDYVFDGFAIAKVKRVIPLNGFAMYAARVIPEMKSVVEKLEPDLPDLGMSHGFILKERDANILSRYRSFEMSVLKRHRAANVFTSVSAIAKLFRKQTMEELKLSKEDYEYLIELVGEEKVIQNLERNTGLAREQLEQALAFKSAHELEESEQGEDDMAKTKAPDTTIAEEQEQEEVLDSKASTMTEDDEDEEEDDASDSAKSGEDADYAALFTKIVSDLGMEKLSEAIQTILTNQEEISKRQDELAKSLESVGGEVSNLKQSDDEKLANAWTPPQFAWMNTHSPSQSNDNVTDEDKKSTDNGSNGTKGPHLPEKQRENTGLPGLWQNQMPEVFGPK